MLIRRPNWYAYLGQDPYWLPGYCLTVAWGHIPDAKPNEIPFRYCRKWSTRRWPRLIWASRPIGYRSHIVPIGFQAFGRCVILWRY